jgi:hypothetical protein
MGFKSKVLAGAAALTLLGGVGTLAAGSASAATPSCGHNCLDLFIKEYGTSHTPAFVLDDNAQSEKVGSKIILYRASNSDPAEDWTVTNEGTVDDFYAAGLVTASLDLHYGSLEAYEIEYSPYGVDSGLCAGVGSTAVDGTGVTLQSCGNTSGTVWVVDTNTHSGSYFPLINGSDTNFSNPYVLNYPGDAYPTDSPRPQLTTWTLSEYSNNTVYDNQLFGADFGVLS